MGDCCNVGPPREKGGLSFWRWRFLFPGQELETAVRLHADLVHIIWNDGHYDMVKFQEEMKYGRAAGVDFGPVGLCEVCRSIWSKGTAGQ